MRELVHFPTRDAWLRWRADGIGGSVQGDLFNDKPDGCWRRAGYELADTTPLLTTDADALFRMRIGLDVEATALGEAAARLDLPITPTPNTGVVGIDPWERASPDGIVAHPPVTHPHLDGAGIAEVKSTAPWLFTKAANEGAKAAWIRQATWTAYCADVEWVLFILLDRAGARLTTFILQRDNLLVTHLRERTHTAWTMHRARELAPPLEDARDARCRRCAFRLQCRGDDPELLDAPSAEWEPDDSPELAQAVAHLDLMREAKRTTDDALELAREAVVERLAVADADGHILRHRPRVELADGRRVSYTPHQRTAADLDALMLTPPLLDVGGAVSRARAEKVLAEAGIPFRAVTLRERFVRTTLGAPVLRAPQRKRR